jgi:hypothetical protein
VDHGRFAMGLRPTLDYVQGEEGRRAPQELPQVSTLHSLELPRTMLGTAHPRPDPEFGIRDQHSRHEPISHGDERRRPDAAVLPRAGGYAGTALPGRRVLAPSSRGWNRTSALHPLIAQREGPSLRAGGVGGICGLIGGRNLPVGEFAIHDGPARTSVQGSCVPPGSRPLAL